ncbi:MAG TPA: DUF2064 domain-containing protein [Thermoanaerobaculia bacterium]|nr:DUF2064 domain-containing protein [Thermoanaerobaculia bacterium]
MKRLSAAVPLFAFGRRRVAEAARSLDVDLFLVGDGDAPEGVRRLEQRGRSFGERLANAFADVLALGYDSVVAVPTDVPQLDARRLAAAFDSLAQGHVALGRSPDGGVYLIGLTRGAESVLSGVRWLTAHVAEDIDSRARERRLAVGWLPNLQDVDGAADLVSLAKRSDLDLDLAALLRQILFREASRPAKQRRLAVPAPPRLAWARPPPAPALLTA